jgi:hypothetical protein
LYPSEQQSFNLRFIGMLFGAYSFIATVIITYVNILKGSALSPLEISALASPASKFAS